MESNGIDHASWSPEKLVARVSALEQQLKEATERYRSQSPSKPPSPPGRPKNARAEREFDPSKYSTRLIALKLAYLGQRYNGFEHHANNKTPLPTIEEEIWKALMKARLIFPTEPLVTEGEVNWEGCDYSKCGRTDKGVSAFGQVIGIRVRSNRPLTKEVLEPELVQESVSSNGSLETASPPLQPLEDDFMMAVGLDDATLDEPLAFHPIRDEVPYAQVLNRLLPPDIRVLAWCPAPPIDFSARFSCRERRYRYFFTQPAFNPTPGPKAVTQKFTHSNTTRREGWLDIAAMQAAAKRFEGLHDFRNFCKVDASKQIDNFERRIFHSEIRELDPTSEPAAYVSGADFSEFAPSSTSHVTPDVSSAAASRSPTPKLYAFVLHGSAFLWHQVRHMIAVLFLVGQGLEPPEVVSQLLDTRATPQKPIYEMAEDAPLVLWDCVFPRDGSTSRDDALEWIYVGDQRFHGDPRDVKGNGKFGLGGVVDDVWTLWRRRKMDEVLAGMLLNVVVGQGKDLDEGQGREEEEYRTIVKSASQKVYMGGDAVRLKGKYVPLMERARTESVQTINARYALRKGFEQGEVVRDSGFRQVALLPRMDEDV
ncbi:hypothetical protein MMC26_001980 [Xylographa opegraphella]|nr:hypothetical protein [Xylographa opegraphella]